MAQHGDTATLGVDHGAFLGGEIFNFVVATLHIHIRLSLFQECGGPEIIKNINGIHGFQRCHHGGAIGLGMNRAVGALEFADRSITVETHNQGIGFVTGSLQLVDVAGVENSEAAVGGGEPLAPLTEGVPPSGQGVRGKDFFLKIQQANPAAAGKGLSIGRVQRRFGS